MVGWYHQHNEHEFSQTPGDSEGQGKLVCCSPWGHKESDRTERLNRTEQNRNSHGSKICAIKESYLKYCGEMVHGVFG